jgi:hypothetical protein
MIKYDNLKADPEDYYPCDYEEGELGDWKEKFREQANDRIAAYKGMRKMDPIHEEVKAVYVEEALKMKEKCWNYDRKWKKV